MAGERSTRHAHYNLNYHLVFTPKHRRHSFYGGSRERLMQIFTDTCAEREWLIRGLEVMPDHVHLFLSAEPGVAPNQIMHALKGYTSRVLRQEYPHLNTLPALWTRSYFVSTAGVISSKMVERYIASQKTRDD